MFGMGILKQSVLYFFYLNFVYSFILCFFLFPIFSYAVKGGEIKYKPYMIASKIALDACKYFIEKVGLNKVESASGGECSEKKDFNDAFTLSCGDLREGRYRSNITTKKNIRSGELIGIISGTLYLQKNHLENERFFDLLT